MRLANERIQKISDIMADLGVVAVASVVLPALLDRFQWVSAVFGSLAAMALLSISVWIVKRKD